MSENGNGTEPQFDFSHVSRRWRRSWVDGMARATDLQIEMMEFENPTDDDPDAQKTMAKQYSKVLRDLESLAAEQERMLARVLVHVPQDWLEPGAPADLDWSDPESLGYVLEARYAELLQAVNSGRQAEIKN